MALSNGDVSLKDEKMSVISAVGILSDDVYEANLNWWRAGLRKKLVSALEYESRWIAAMQDRIRTPALDTYFLYTSSLGTPTFFTIMLPLFFFFGYDEFGRGFLAVLAIGVYASSFIKDLFCSPRPFVPPVTRLTIGNHHLEYGFPSTHSTNSVTMALYVYAYVHAAYTSNALPTPSYILSTILIIFYAFSIVFGRVYAGMHSFTDCAAGSVLGALVWAGYTLLRERVEAWLGSGTWSVPLVLLPTTVLLVNRHPQPVDDCPCFEDAIAFMAVLLGQCLARWHAVRTNLDTYMATSFMDGSPSGSLNDRLLFWGVVCVKVLGGLTTVFVWRILAKSTLHAVLPPTFRFIAQGFQLPNRRFYIPATEYKDMPTEKGLHPIPSVIDLPGTLHASTTTAIVSPYAKLNGELKMRNGKFPPLSPHFEKNIELPAAGPEEEGDGKHYDADVITKVIVYAGIGCLVNEILPVVFVIVGLGVSPA